MLWHASQIPLQYWHFLAVGRLPGVLPSHRPVGEGHQEVTASSPVSWIWVIRALYPLLCPWNLGSACISHCQRLFQGQNLETVMWCWEHLCSTHEWSQLNFIDFKIWQADARIHLFYCYPRQASYICSLCLVKLPPMNLDGLTLSLLSPYPLSTGTSFTSHQSSSWGTHKPT